ncbi:hypothetical protein [Micromonospora sp. NPDC047527]|uniref:hypothetical protein n=1 Tax=unclassified Micromonospora TaxID=2617518 RepID=UPI0033CFCFFB
MDNISSKVDRAIAGAQEGDKIARAVAAAQDAERVRTEPPARANRAWLVADAAKRYSLGEDLAARITGNSPTEIQREARTLALDRARVANDAARDAQPEAPRPALVSGRTPADQSLYDFDPTDVVRQVRQTS